MITVTVLGNGNVGTQLCKAFLKSTEVLLLENYNRKGLPISGCHVTVTSDLQQLKKADVYIVAYGDQALFEVSDTLKHLDGIIVHTSGATSMKVFSDFSEYGVLYPIQSIRKELAINFKKIPFGIEGSTPTVTKTLKKIANSISNHVDILDSQQRLQLHVAAVFANNFSNFMFSQAAEICGMSNIDFQLLLPLISDSIKKLEISDPRKIQTGPAVRNDEVTIEKHLDILKNKEQKHLYKTLTKAIQDYYGQEL